MRGTEGVWRCSFNALPLVLKVKFLIEENAYFRWEKRVRDGIPGTPRDDWLWAEEFVNYTWAHLVIAAFYPPRNKDVPKPSPYSRDYD